MTRRTYYWRNVICEGCELHCRYRDFKLFDKPYQEMFAMMWEDKSDPREWEYKRRGTILGRLHQMKREAWESMIAGCPNNRRENYE